MAKYFWYVYLEYALGETRKKYSSCGLAAGWIDLANAVVGGLRSAYAQLGTVTIDARMGARIQTGHRLLSTLPDDKRKELLRRVVSGSEIFQEVNHLVG